MKKICFLLLLSLTLVQSVQAQTLHAIVFANTKCPGDPEDPTDIGIGPSVMCDYQRMRIELETIATFCGYKKDFQMYEGSPQNFCRDKLEYALNNLKCGKNDIVFFYYSGHGGRPEVMTKDSFPHMQLLVNPFNPNNIIKARNYYPLSQVLKRIKSKRPRLAIVIGDLCNSTSPLVPVENVASMRGITKISKIPCEFYRALFLKVKGSIIATSSRPKEVSKGDAVYGGYFTASFTEALQIMITENMKPDWNTLFEGSKIRTRARTGGEQNPYWELDIHPADEAPTHDVLDNPEPVTPPVQTDGIDTYLTTIGNDHTPINERIRLIDVVLSKFFSSPKAKVEVVGKDGKTIVATKYADMYLNNLSIARKLVKVVTVNQEVNGSGKLISLKVHEMYKL